MELKVFEQKIGIAQARLENWLQKIMDVTPTSDQLCQATEEIVVGMEELEVAIEELYQQQEELQAANQKAEAERERYLELFDYAPDGYLITNISGIIQEANLTVTEMLNRRQDYLVGKPMSIFIPQTERRSFYNLLNRLRQEESIKDLEICLQPSNNRSSFTAAISIAPIKDKQNQLVGLRWLLRDVTELRETQTENQRQQERSRLIAEITLKIRQSWQLETILQTAVTESQKLLKTDTVLIVQLESNNSVTVVAEASSAEKSSLLGQNLTCAFLATKSKRQDICGVIQVIPEYYFQPARTQSQLEAISELTNLVAPIFVHQKLWGFLAFHRSPAHGDWGLGTGDWELGKNLITPGGDLINLGIEAKRDRLCHEVSFPPQSPITEAESITLSSASNERTSRRLTSQWEDFEIDICEQLADQIGIAITQAQLIRNMEQLVTERTQELREANQQLQQEIEERLEVEESLRHSQEQLYLIADSLPVLISYVNVDRRYCFNNRAYEDWFGKPLTEICGSKIREVLGEKAYEQIEDKIEAVLSGRKVSFEMEMPYKDVGLRWVKVNYIPHQEEEKVIGFFTLTEDISELKAIEQIKDEFVSVVSHELRTPLTSIHGSLRLLNAGKFGYLGDKGQQLIGIAEKNTERLVRLVNDILDLQRMGSDKITLELKPCNTADLISTAIETMEELAQSHNIKLGATSGSIPLFADPDSILQALTNLISNAIKFSLPDSTVWVQVENRDTDILFQVGDQGRGIPPDKLESIFERFQQVDVSDSRQKQGTGLGLAICRKIVELHQGKIWAESTLNKGSTFYFTIPKANIGQNQVKKPSKTPFRAFCFDKRQ